MRPCATDLYYFALLWHSAGSTSTLSASCEYLGPNVSNLNLLHRYAHVDQAHTHTLAHNEGLRLNITKRTNELSVYEL